MDYSCLGPNLGPPCWRSSLHLPGLYVFRGQLLHTVHTRRVAKALLIFRPPLEEELQSAGSQVTCHIGRSGGTTLHMESVPYPQSP